MPQDDEVKARMSKALQLARDCLASAHLLSGPGPLGRRPGEANPDALPIAVLAAELYKHVEP
jgi:hypothetical protein